MTGPEHYREAEEHMAAIDGKTKDAVLVLLAKAQVHATLALAAAAGLAPGRVRDTGDPIMHTWWEVAS